MKTANIICPNCKNKIRAFLESNHWVKWIKIDCQTCGYYYQLKDTQFDFIQPSSPLFELIYKSELKPKEDKENKKSERDKRLWRKSKEGRLKPWEEDYIKKYTKERGLE